MDEFELQSIGIGEEQGIVALTILRIVGRRVENCSANPDETPVQQVNVVTRLGKPRKVMETAGIAIMLPAVRRTLIPTDGAQWGRLMSQSIQVSPRPADR